MLSRPIRPLAAIAARSAAHWRWMSSGSHANFAPDGGLGVASSRSSRPQHAPQPQSQPSAPSAQQSSPPRARRMKQVPIEQLSLGTDPDDSNLTLGQHVSREEWAHSTPAAFAEMTVRDVLASKASTYGTQVHSVSPDESIAAALQTMSFFNVGALLVMEGGSLAGVLSTRDLLKRIDDAWRPFDPKSTRVRELMTPGSSVVYVDGDTSVLRAMAMMSSGGFRHLPVLEDGKVSGVLSIGDCVRALMTQYQDKSDFLEDLVKGKYPA